MLPDLDGKRRSVSLRDFHALDHTRFYAKGRSLRRKLHHLAHALAVVLGEVKGLAVGGGAEAGLKAGGLLIESQNRRDLAGCELIELDGGMRLGVVIEEVKACGRYGIVSPETHLGATRNND